MEKASSYLRARVAEDLEPVPDWQIGVAEWLVVRDALLHVAAGVDAGDSEGVAQWMAVVKQHEPRRRDPAVRGLSAGDEPLAPPSDVRELLNYIVHGADSDGAAGAGRVDI